MVLFINACVRAGSRTRQLAEALLARLGTYEEVGLGNSALQPLDEEALNKRNALIASGNYSDPMFDSAKQFAAADTVVIAAPYWDGSFPAILRVYLENIYAIGIVTRYGADGSPVGLCSAGKLYYVTTAGGPYVPDYSYTYLQQLATRCFGIPETHLIKAEMLDVDGADPEAILREAAVSIDNLITNGKS